MRIYNQDIINTQCMHMRHNLAYSPSLVHYALLLKNGIVFFKCTSVLSAYMYDICVDVDKKILVNKHTLVLSELFLVFDISTCTCPYGILIAESKLILYLLLTYVSIGTLILQHVLFSH